MTTATLENPSSLISALGLDDSFQPQEPSTIKDTGLSEAMVEDLILKFLSGIGSESGRVIADSVCLPMAILEDRFVAMRQRQEIAPSGSAMLGDHIYRLTDVGRDRAHRALHHPLLWPEHSHSARTRRRRQDHQDVRRLVP